MSDPAHPASPARPRVLIVSHAKTRCGVHQYGVNIAAALKKSAKYEFLYAECSSAAEFRATVRRELPSAIIYNYVFNTLPWVRRRVLREFRVPHIAIIHEGAQEAADEADGLLFDYHISHDPTLLLHNSLVFKTGRIVPRYVNRFPVPAVPTIGSFGFGLEGKGFEELITVVQQQFDRAILRFHIPLNDVVDAEGTQAAETARRCRSLITKPGIELKLSHEFISTGEMLDFLAQNTLNAFFYTRYHGRGVSSVIDYSLAVQRPIAISKSEMFRHLRGVTPSICYEDTPLHTIIENGFEPLRPLLNEWTEENFIWDYERILDKILQSLYPSHVDPPFSARVRKFLGRHGLIPPPSGDKRMRAPEWPIQQTAVAPSEPTNGEIQGPIRYNRILDDAARAQYAPVIKTLWQLVPEMMARKVSAANVQQAFVFDTVRRFAADGTSRRILSVGSYEDTASAGLRKLGISIEEIDPVLNYDLDTFVRKPSTRRGSYDIVFSTSVIEHVQNDDLFVREIADLLSEGGVAILTCDFLDSYRPGEKIPVEDFRLYTQRDFRERLLPQVPNCTLVDSPEWDTAAPDFEYAGCRYSFASLVFRKVAA